MTTSKRWLAGIAAAGSLVFAASGLAQQQGDGHGDHQVRSEASGQSSEASEAYREAATRMQHDMELANSGDPDVDFATGMLAHHMGAVAMAEVELDHGKDPEMRALAQKIIEAQQAEIEQMRAWLKAKPAPAD